jgi:hypothetical protein
MEVGRESASGLQIARVALDVTHANDILPCRTTANINYKDRCRCPFIDTTSSSAKAPGLSVCILETPAHSTLPASGLGDTAAAIYRVTALPRWSYSDNRLGTLPASLRGYHYIEAWYRAALRYREHNINASADNMARSVFAPRECFDIVRPEDDLTRVLHKAGGEAEVPVVGFGGAEREV